MIKLNNKNTNKNTSLFAPILRGACYHKVLTFPELKK